MKVLIVGAGLTGSLVAALLSKGPNAHQISVWEKAPWTGGRTYTYTDSTSGLSLNMGAQYVSRTKVDDPSSEYSKLKDETYRDLLSTGILVPHTGVIEGLSKEHMQNIQQNYSVSNGFSSLVDHFLSKSSSGLKLNHSLTKVVINNSGPAQFSISCYCPSKDEPSDFDAVVLTMPAPDLLELKGNLFDSLDRDKFTKLSSVTYAPRYALGLFYSGIVPKTTWKSKYFPPDSSVDEDGLSIIRYLSWGDIVKESKVFGSSLLVHSGIEFAAKHKENTNQEAIQCIMQNAVESLVPNLPPPSHCKLVFWKYGRANRIPAYHDTPGCLLLSRDPMVVATGDGLCDTNFESCIRAALAAVRAVSNKEMVGL